MTVCYTIISALHSVRQFSLETQPCPTRRRGRWDKEPRIPGTADSPSTPAPNTWRPRRRPCRLADLPASGPLQTLQGRGLPPPPSLTPVPLRGSRWEGPEIQHLPPKMPPANQQRRRRETGDELAVNLLFFSAPGSAVWLVGSLFPNQGSKPGPPAEQVLSPKHCTARELPVDLLTD